MPGFVCWFSRLPVFIAMVLAIAGEARSEEAKGGPHWQVVVECEVVVLPQKAALRLIPDLGDEAKIDAAWGKVRTMIDEGEARLAANLFGSGAEGQRLVVETVEELRFPTLFEAVVPPLATPREQAVEMLKHWPVIGIFPMAFETRNTGSMLEVEAAVSANGQWVQVWAVLNYVRLLRFSQEEAGLLPSGRQMTAAQPQFAAIKENVHLQARSGQRVLMSVHKIPDAEELMELAVLRVRAVPAGGAP